jgi:hypothetical protein
LISDDDDEEEEEEADDKLEDEVRGSVVVRE